MTTVIKRGGQRQSFMPSKIKSSIKSAARQAGLSRKKVEETVKEVGNSAIAFAKKKRVIKTTDIRKSILGRLGRVSKAAASAWKRNERKKKKKTVKKKVTRKKTKKKTTKKRRKRKR